MTEASIAQMAAELLWRYKLQLGIAESCTGGLMGSQLTDIPGSSAFFSGGVITYSYDAKETLLKVDHADLLKYGAVSAEVAVQMANGARKLFNSDYALSITGIAGPGGELPGKPVGLTYLGVAFKDGVIWRKHVWSGNRSENKQYSVNAALQFLVATILSREGENESPAAPK